MLFRNSFLKKLASNSSFLKNKCLNHVAYLNYSGSETRVKNLKSLIENSASFEEKDPPADQWLTSPYPTDKRSQQSARPNVDPRLTSVILFPGQGSQFVGMAKSLIDFPNVMDMFESASEILRYNLLDLCIHGPRDMLNMTVHSQVAVMVSSLAAVEKLRAENVKAIENCAATAGFSVGEYASLVFAGAIEFEDAVRLLRVRGEAMQAASDLQSSGMMTAFLTTEAKIKNACKCAREWCEKQGIDGGECTVASYLFPHCKVISGHTEALNYLELNGAEFGIKKVKYLPVSGAFHSRLMLPAKSILQKALKSTPVETPIIPVHSNINGKKYLTPDQIKTNLSDQLVQPVKWEQTMHAIYERDKGIEFPNTYECGPGTSLKSILRMNNNEAYKKCENVLV